MEQYYVELIKKLKKYLNEEKFDLVLEIAEEELKAPYIPWEIEKDVYKFKAAAEMALDAIEAPKYNKQLTLEEIKEKLSKDVNDFEALFLIKQLKNFNLNLVLKEIENFFQNKELQWYTKYLMIHQLVKQKINHSFKLSFINKYTEQDSYVIFNPIELDYKSFEQTQMRAFGILEQTVQIKDPSLFAIARVICMDLICQLFLFDKDITLYDDAIAFFSINDALDCLRVDDEIEEYMERPSQEKIKHVMDLIWNKGKYD